VVVDGLLNLNKPLGVTSAKALTKVRAIVGQKKSGHAGALDPLADGVLVLCFGAATKLVERMMDQPKVYRATIALDITNECYDLERPTRPVAATPPTPEQLRAALAQFVGRIAQVPPASSALKVGGKPAYELHRAGRAPVLAARTIEIYWLHLHAYCWPLVEIEVACGRGTYVRALARSGAGAGRRRLPDAPDTHGGRAPAAGGFLDLGAPGGAGRSGRCARAPVNGARVIDSPCHDSAAAGGRLVPVYRRKRAGKMPWGLSALLTICSFMDNMPRIACGLGYRSQASFL
jgi:tRNA pseudouridine55 synthase